MSVPRANVFVIDDDPVWLFAMSTVLRSAGYAVAAFAQPEALLERLSAGERGCAVLDLHMPGYSGLELQRAIFDLGVALPLIFVSGSAEVPAVVAAIRQGAVDFLPKPVSASDLLAAVERALRQDAEIAAEGTARELARARWTALSPREQDVCRLFARGLLNKQIGAELGTGESTVQAQRASALKKLGVSTVTELVRLMDQARARR